MSSAEDTLSELLELSLSFEREAGLFYRGLGKRFTHIPEACEFFEAMAGDEETHEAELLRLKGAAEPELLDSPVDSADLESARVFLRFSAEESLEKSLSVEDAYRLAIKLEYSEVNKAYQYLVERLAASEKERASAIAALNEHYDRLKQFQNVVRSFK